MRIIKIRIGPSHKLLTNKMKLPRSSYLSARWISCYEALDEAVVTTAVSL